MKYGRLAFLIGFTRGLKRNAWRLKEWQRLPNTSLDSDVSHLDLDTDVHEKRIGVFHELLHFTIQLKNECMNVSTEQPP